jgi:regulator of protease activity HflC (stomatin/prohibitin superfamily)
VVDQVDIQRLPPRQLQAEFNAVSEAAVKRGKTLNEAKTYQSQMINRAKSDVTARIALAEADRTRLVAFVAAEAERFNHLLPKYRSQPDLFIRQYKTDTMNRVLTNVHKYVLPPGTPGNPSQLRIELDRERPKPKIQPPPAPEKGH